MTQTRNPSRLHPLEIEKGRVDLSLYATEDRKDLRSDLVKINLGPHHPSTHGVLHFFVTLDGETVVDLRVIFGYLHRSMEKLFEGRTYVGNVALTDRMDYTAAMLNNWGWCLACEKLAGLEVNERSRSFGVALTSCTVPAAGKPTFELGEQEIELGIGIHGEPGRSRGPLGTAREITSAALDAIQADMPLTGDLLEAKLAAIRSMTSQIEPLIQALGEEFFREGMVEESFRAP